VRSLSTRASITATSFVNEYHWGNFRGDPRRMMERYYDAHLYLTNWGTHRIMLHLPRDLLDIDVARDHCIGDQVTAWTTRKFLILDMTSQDDSGDWEYDPQGRLSAIAGGESSPHRTRYQRPPAALSRLASRLRCRERDENAFDRDEDQWLTRCIAMQDANMTTSLWMPNWSSTVVTCGSRGCCGQGPPTPSPENCVSTNDATSCSL
jgi:hypothetical protein